MKLIHQLNRKYLTYAAILFFVVGIILFVLLRSIVREETDEKLVSMLDRIESVDPGEGRLFEMFPIISVKPSEHHSDEVIFSDTVLQIEDEGEAFRQLTAFRQIDGKNYKVVIRESSVESSDLLASLTLMIILSFGGLLFLFFLINRRISQKLWNPFFVNLEKLKQFSLQSAAPFSPEYSDTDEFREMNKVLKGLTDKILSDYDNLKKFSENASHELQTPLAVIRSKTEALLEEDQLSQNQISKIEAIYKSVNRLSKINSGLLLLSRIENRQFTEAEKISLNEIMKQHMENFNELMEIKKLTFTYDFQSDWIIECNRILLDMLINNLFGNAIIHNSESGILKIILSNGQLTFYNSGNKPLPDGKELFERFRKGDRSDSVGLGLAISKQICTYFGWQLSYRFEKQMHVFTIHSTN